MTATETLIEAGRTLATLAEPGRDLYALAGDIGDITVALTLLERGLRNAQERADETRDNRLENLAAGRLWHIAERREHTRDEVELAHRNELARARAGAMRGLGRAIVEAARIVREMEVGP